jgi:predicted ABC-type ATPase
VREFVNADVIARGLSAFDPDSVAVAAGRIMLQRLDDLAAQRASFAFETTLASRSFAPRIQRQIAAGYDFHLVYVWLRQADLSVERVAGRVRRGGHGVPDDVIRRRSRVRVCATSSSSIVRWQRAGACTTILGGIRSWWRLAHVMTW